MLVQKVKELMPDQTWYPKKTCLAKVLSVNNYVKRRPCLKPVMTAPNKAKRLAFAKKWLVNGECKLENVI